MQTSHFARFFKDKKSVGIRAGCAGVLFELSATNSAATLHTIMAEPSPTHAEGLKLKAKNAVEQLELKGQPKSGTTWLEVVITTALTVCCANGTPSNGTREWLRSCRFEYIAERHPLLQVASLPAVAPARTVSLKLHAGYGKHELPVRLEKLESNSAARVNLPVVAKVIIDECVRVNRSLWSDECLKRVIAWPVHSPSHNVRFLLVLRDPRAVAVSWFHYSHMPLPGTLNHTRAATATAAPLLDFAERSAAAISLRFVVHTRFTAHTLMLYYEDLLADTSRCMGMLFSYIGLPAIGMEDMRSVVTRTSADAMREMEAQHKLPGPNRPGTDTAKVRSASANSFEAELGAELLERITRTICPALVDPLRHRWLLRDDCRTMTAPLTR